MAEVALFSLSQKDIDETIGDDSKGLADLIDRPKNFGDILWLITVNISGNFILIYWEKLVAAISSPALKFTVEVIVVTFYFVV
jgi:hypothetical protein